MAYDINKIRQGLWLTDEQKKQIELKNNGENFRVRLFNGLIITLADNFYAWESTKHIVMEVLKE